MDLSENGENQAAALLERLKDMDKQLSELQKKLAESKLGGIKNSFFTANNIKETIALLEKVNPEDKNLIHTLRSMIPLAEKSDDELERLADREKIKSEPSNEPHEGTAFTSKVKCKIPCNRLI